MAAHFGFAALEQLNKRLAMLVRIPRFSIKQVLIAQAAMDGAISVILLWVSSGRHIERLNSPVAVVGWSASGLDLANGRRLTLPGIKTLPVRSAALTEATKRGVENAADARVYCLVRIPRVRGNDPIREHIARVDLAHLLEFVGEGDPSTQQNKWKSVRWGGSFSQSGGDIGEFHAFRLWCNLGADERIELANYSF